MNIKKLIARNKRTNNIFKWTALGSTLVGLVVLAVLLIDIASDGLLRIDMDFLRNFPSRKPERAGILSALVGTLYIMTLTAAISFPLGVGAGIYLEEYAGKGRLTKIIEINITNLAGVPSIIYGLLGLGIFVRGLSLDRSLITGALTLTLLILPIIITATREALRAVPFSIREASYALGATVWQTTWRQVLPAALPGILTGMILALSRAIGETAPLIAIGALTYIAFLPESLLDPFTVMPIQVFNWVSRPQSGFATNAAAAIIVLLFMVLAMNTLAVILRQWFGRKVKW
ncbi:MAG: phosphate ABC transporter permease PstA [Deltaproteobacteria bacterium]|nr:phosphate ABC transporter permease PstA [Deltaproteobacteria bacterium]